MRLAILAALLTTNIASAGPLQVELLGGHSTPDSTTLGTFAFSSNDNGAKVSFTPSPFGPAGYVDPAWISGNSNDVLFHVPFDVNLRITNPAGVSSDVDVTGYVNLSWIHRWDGSFILPEAFFGGNPMQVTVGSDYYSIMVLDNTDSFLETASCTVQVSAAAPEPGTFVLALLGLAPVAGRLRRRLV